MKGPSRTMMLKHKPNWNLVPKKHGDYKVQEKYHKGHSTDLVIARSTVTPEFIEAFCAEHSIDLKLKGEYYYLS